MSKIISGALLLISMIGPATAGLPAAVPTPDIGGGAIGTLLAAGAAYLIKRRGR
jgi:hypothetical protein